MIRTFHGVKPTVPKSCLIEETAVVIGEVVMGEDCSVWFNAVIRGDVNYIRIGERTNVQDLCTLHVTHDTHPLIIGNDVTIGHNVVLHGCTIQDRVLVGMGAIIMDGAVIGEDSVVGAGALVVEGTIVPPNYSIEPDTAILTHDHIADHNGSFFDKARLWHGRLDALKGANHAGTLGEMSGLPQESATRV